MLLSHLSKWHSVLLVMQRLARTINHVDERFNPPIPQVVFYQSGVGTENNFYSEYIEGTSTHIPLQPLLFSA